MLRAFSYDVPDCKVGATGFCFMPVIFRSHFAWVKTKVQCSLLAMETQEAVQFCSQQQRKNCVQGYQILAKLKPFHLNDSLEIFLAEIWKKSFAKYTMGKYGPSPLLEQTVISLLKLCLNTQENLLSGFIVSHNRPHFSFWIAHRNSEENSSYVHGLSLLLTSWYLPPVFSFWCIKPLFPFFLFLLGEGGYSHAVKKSLLSA